MSRLLDSNMVGKSDCDKMLPFTFDLKDSALVFVDDSYKLQTLRHSMSLWRMIGIDTETKPAFQKNKKNATSLIQIAGRTEGGEESVFIIDMLSMVIQEKNMQELDTFLYHKLSDDECVKVGHNLSHDFIGLRKDYPQMKSFKEVKNIVEVTSFLPHLDPHAIYGKSLQKLVKSFLHSDLDKSAQLSNWNRRPLDPRQIHYAACDALVLLRLYDVLLCEALDRNKSFSISQISEIVKLSDEIMERKRNRKKRRGPEQALENVSEGDELDPVPKMIESKKPQPSKQASDPLPKKRSVRDLYNVDISAFV